MKTTEGIKYVFKLKRDNAGPPDIYLGASHEQFKTKGRTKCWSISAKKYVKAAVVNLEATLAKRYMWLTTSNYPIPTNYHTSEDVSNELNAQEVQAYQVLIGELRWAVEIGRVESFLEVVLLSSHLALPQSVHLQAEYQIFGYLKQVPKRKLYFDPVSLSISKYWFQNFEWEDFYRDAKEAIPDDMPQSRGKLMSMHCFEYVDHASEKVTSRSLRDILIFCKRVPIMWLSKKHNSVETSTFGSKFTALKLTVELVIALRYKLRVFDVPLEGPTDMLCYNEAVFKNTSTPESVLRKKYHSITYHKCGEYFSALTYLIYMKDT